MALGKFRRPGKERESHALETLFGHGFNDGRLPAHFGQHSRGESLIEKTNVDGGKFRFFQPLI